MKKYSKYSIFLILTLLFCTCKKKTSTEVIIFNYALGEPVANAKVVLVERKLSGFAASYSCEEIDSRTTDANGKCSFDNKKFKTNSKYQYYTAVTEAYGKSQSYPCGGKTRGFLKVGTTNKSTDEIGIIPAYFKVQLNSLFDPAQAGDSLYITIRNPNYQVPGQPYPVGGGGVYSGGGIYNGTIPPAIILNEKKTLIQAKIQFTFVNVS
jgi:hypothetical protein